MQATMSVSSVRYDKHDRPRRSDVVKAVNKTTCRQCPAGVVLLLVEYLGRQEFTRHAGDILLSLSLIADGMTCCDAMLAEMGQ